MLIDVNENQNSSIIMASDSVSRGSGATGYHYIIYLYFLLRLVASLCMLRLNLDFKPPAKKIFKNLQKVLCKVDVISYLVIFLVAGVIWGFLESFLFWYMEDIGASKLLLGVSLGIGTLTGVPLTIFSHLLLKNVGNVSLFFSVS